MAEAIKKIEKYTSSGKQTFEREELVQVNIPPLKVALEKVLEEYPTYE
jgi:hypothetical protein